MAEVLFTDLETVEGFAADARVPGGLALVTLPALVGKHGDAAVWDSAILAAFERVIRTPEISSRGALVGSFERFERNSIFPHGIQHFKHSIG